MKKTLSLVLSLVSLFSLSTTALAVESTEDPNLYLNEKQPKNIALLHAPRPTQETLDNSGLYTKVQLSSEPIMENGQQVGSIETYTYLLPSFMKSSTGYEHSVYQAQMTLYKEDSKKRVYLTGYFMYDYETVSCYDTSVDCTSYVKEFDPEPVKVTGNGTKKATAKLNFTWKSDFNTDLHKDYFSLSCTNDGTPKAHGIYSSLIKN